jgi:hypothetical protein
MVSCPQVREGLLPLIRAIREKGTPPDASVLEGMFDTGAQADLCNAIARELGFDLERGRLDVSVHPFTGGEALLASHLELRSALHEAVIAISSQPCKSSSAQASPSRLSVSPSGHHFLAVAGPAPGRHHVVIAACGHASYLLVMHPCPYGAVRLG